MVLEAKRLTVEAFDLWVELPQNRDKLFEYIGGEVFEEFSNPYASYISGRFQRLIANFVEDNDLGFVTGEAGGYMVSGERYTPHLAYISKVKQPDLAQRGYNPLPPDLAVEVDFPSTYQSQEDLRFKVANYLAAGTLVWIARPETKVVEVYAPGKPLVILGIDNVLDGGDVLPGFTLAVKDVFKR